MAINNLINTNHSTIRCQQRGIKSEYLELLDLYGIECPSPGGGTRVMFNKKARKRIERECKNKQVLDYVYLLANDSFESFCFVFFEHGGDNWVDECLDRSIAKCEYKASPIKHLVGLVSVSILRYKIGVNS